MAAESALLRFEPGLMIWTVVTFVLTLLVLRKIAWIPMLAALDDREKKIHDALTQAEKANKQAEEAIAQAKRDSSEGLKKSEQMVARAKEEAEHLRAKMLEEAKAESQKTIEQGLRRIEAEQRSAMQELRRTTADLAIQAASKLVRSSMTPEEQRRLVDDFIAQTPEKRVN